MQVAETVVPALHLPEGVTTAVVALTLLGFPIALVIAWAFEMTPEGMKRTENVSPNEHIPQWSRRKFGGLVVATALVASALLVFNLLRPSQVAPIPSSSAVAIPANSIAVLPFENQNKGNEIEYLSDGIAEALINSLTELPQLRVTARSTAFHYKSKDADPQMVGRALRMRTVLMGRVRQTRDTLNVQVDLVDAVTGTQLWGEEYERKAADLLLVKQTIAREVTANLKMKLTGNEQKSLDRRDTTDAQAYQFYLKGRFSWNKRTGESIEKAIGYFNQAIEKDSSFGLAYAGLADCYVIPANPAPPTEKMPKAKAAAIRALELDDSLAEAHNSLARVLMLYDWNWTAAEKEFKRAIELNPRDATAHQWYGGYLEAVGRNDQAIAERKRAQELDPLSLVVNFELGTAFYYARDYDRAIEQFQKTLELDPNFPLVQQFLPGCYEQKGMYSQAITGFKKAAVRGSTEWSFKLAGLGHVYAVSGRNDEARAVLDELKQASSHEYVPADAIAVVYAGLGEKEEVFAWLIRLTRSTHSKWPG